MLYEVGLFDSTLNHIIYPVNYQRDAISRNSDHCNFKPINLKKKNCNRKNCLYIDREKEYNKKINYWVGLGCRFDHKLLIGPPVHSPNRRVKPYYISCDWLFQVSESWLAKKK